MSRSAQNKNRQGREDKRPLVLLVLGLLILAGDFFSLFPLNAGSNQAGDFCCMSVAWLSCGRIHDGLYALTPQDIERESLRDCSQLHLVSFGTDSGHLPDQGEIPGRAAFLFFHPLSINHADQCLLSSIPGIGPQLSGRIVELREKQGPFSHLDDLLQVRGIGEKKLDKIKKYCCI